MTTLQRRFNLRLLIVLLGTMAAGALFAPKFQAQYALKLVRPLGLPADTWEYYVPRDNLMTAAKVELGRRLFEKEARRFDLNPKTVLESEELAKFAAEYGAQKPDELLAHIGYGKLSPRTVLQKSVPGGQLKERPQDSAVVSVVKRVLRPGASDKIKVRGTDDIMVFRAKCCNPIRGEKIVGYITRGKGVSVHAATCSNVLNLMFDPERRIDVEWDTTTSDQAPYTVRLTMQVEDRKGMLAEISAKVSGINTNITNMEARTGEDQQARIDMTFEISDVKHLERVIKSIKGVQGVLGVERTARA